MATTRELVEQINRIFTENKMEEFTDFLSEDIIWDMYTSASGHTRFEGKESIANMEGGEQMPAQMNFKFGTIVIEGDTASVECTSSGTTPDGKSYQGSSCDIYHFKDGKVHRMTSYVIDSIK